MDAAPIEWEGPVNDVDEMVAALGLPDDLVDAVREAAARQDCPVWKCNKKQTQQPCPNDPETYRTVWTCVTYTDTGERCGIEQWDSCS